LTNLDSVKRDFFLFLSETASVGFGVGVGKGWVGIMVIELQIMCDIKHRKTEF
jgi:hypothetical protein